MKPKDILLAFSVMPALRHISKKSSKTCSNFFIEFAPPQKSSAKLDIGLSIEAVISFVALAYKHSALWLPRF